MKSVVIWCFVWLFGLSNAAFKLEERYSWNQLDFVFPSRNLKDIALASGTYIPQNALPVGVEHWGNKLFVTVPRWKDGIPATLNYIDTTQTISGSPPLIPYPDWRSNAVGDCLNGLNTVYRIKADKCGRLWVLDTGTIGIGNTTQNVCPYSINVFDLATNTRIRRYEFRADDTNVNTFIANTAVDIGRNCDDTYAYFSDELGYGLIVYSWEQNRSWRFEHSYFYPDPLRGDFNIGGLNFQWGEEGIFGLALSPTRSDGFRTLYFSPLASHREFSVSTRILRDESRAEDSYHDFFFFPAERGSNSHTTARVVSDDGVMLFNLIDQNAVGCWHTSMPYTPQYHGVADRDDVGLIFPADVKVDENRNVWVLSDRMPNFLISTLDYSDINFRIYSTSLQNLIGGSICDISNRVSSRFGLNSILSGGPNGQFGPNSKFGPNSQFGSNNQFGSNGQFGPTNTFGANVPNNQFGPTGPNVANGPPNLLQNVGLGAFKTNNALALNGNPQSLQNLQGLNQPLNAQSLQVPLQPLNAQTLRVPLHPFTQNSQLTSISQLSPQFQQIPQISPISQVQPLLSYDVREPLSTQSLTKPLPSVLPTFSPTKTTPQGTFFKGTTFGATVSQQSTDFTTAIQNLPKSPSWWTPQLW